MDESKPQVKLILLIIPLFLIGVLYPAIQDVAPQGFDLTTPIDVMIPYVSYFVIPYILYFPFIILPFLLLWKRSNDYKNLALTYITVLIISQLIFLSFQTTMTRADVQPADIFDELVIQIYSADKPLNLLPSLHTALSIVAALFIWKFNKKLGVAAVILTVLIIISTLLIKQHVIPDAIAGILLAFGSYYLIRRKYDTHTKDRT